ncbi:MAG: phosphoribosyltransferase family protein [SAR324 cluster bacterium]|nr:phosphoribosyltransferase family protein [SAR324 cluster bacterium]MCZ6628963.1 phosphoribosyltransferase family protein [SAR324 cluster bacterium]MCZ6728684.1 phosphoribosyltransferase family protein [SAR324 cluster bacterium]MCZ6841517.1 phosphoribosyltransferase family protein [SAR324 cluster bacterium]
MAGDAIIVSNWSDSSFALDVAHNFGQTTDISDLISLKIFANSEFCPRFLVDDSDLESIGCGLEGKRVYLISTTSSQFSRIELATRNFLIASAAKENGAERVVLVEPDLFFSAQDRGPHFLDHPQMTSPEERKKFDGQPFSAQLYGEILRTSGVDQVVTVHNHKPAVLAQIYGNIFQDAEEKLPFVNLDIAHIVANFIQRTVSVEKNGANLGFVAPDHGAAEFVSRVREFTGLQQSVLVVLDKTRLGQRSVEITSSDDLTELKGREVFILDDMVRTGGTIAGAIKFLAENRATRPENIFFYCTHSYISPEGRENLNSPHLTEFITTNTLPNVLNRDDQGRLRRKMVVLKIENWIADALTHCLEGGQLPTERYGALSVSPADQFYKLDYSSKNLRRAAQPENQLTFPLSTT